MNDEEEHAARRYSDEMLFRLDERVKTLTERVDQHLSWAELQKEALEKRMGVIEVVWHSIETPVKYVGWAVTIFLAVLITTMAKSLMEWVKLHWTK
jgi:hypothetical protein